MSDVANRGGRQREGDPAYVKAVAAEYYRLRCKEMPDLLTWHFKHDVYFLDNIEKRFGFSEAYIVRSMLKAQNLVSENDPDRQEKLILHFTYDQLDYRESKIREWQTGEFSAIWKKAEETILAMATKPDSLIRRSAIRVMQAMRNVEKGQLTVLPKPENPLALIEVDEFL